MFAKCYKVQKFSLIPEIFPCYSHISRNHTSHSEQFKNVAIIVLLMILTKGLPTAVSSYVGDCYDENTQGETE